LEPRLLQFFKAKILKIKINKLSFPLDYSPPPYAISNKNGTEVRLFLKNFTWNDLFDEEKDWRIFNLSTVHGNVATASKPFSTKLISFLLSLLSAPLLGLRFQVKRSLKILQK